MGRFLIYFSYVGTGFSGLQLQGQRPVKTVISVFRDALTKSRLSNDSCNITTSSRTDKDVHALCNTVHTDLPAGPDGEQLDPSFITRQLNQTFLEFEENIRVLKTLRVADNFHSRFQTLSRTYVYRICVAKDGRQLDWALHYSPFELMRSYMIRNPVDMGIVNEAAKILAGMHDFRAFTTPTSLIKQPWQNPVKSLRVNVEPGCSLLTDYTARDSFNYWNFVFQSHSFLYKQIRKMTAALIAAGQGLLSVEDIRSLVEKPECVGAISKTHIFDIPAYALYLTNVEYNDKDLVFNPLQNVASEVPECDSVKQQSQ